MMSEAEIPSRWRVIFLAALCATPPLSTDMYLVAIPHLSQLWQTPASTINLSLVLWFVAFSIGLLIFGSLSDKVGRRPVLLGGVALFSLASVLCALATSPLELILFRVLQGVAASAPSSMSLAYCRDKFTGRTRQRILAWMGIIVSIAPMIAPSIGAFVMAYAPWQTIFVLLGVISAVLYVLAWKFFDESSTTRESGGVLHATKRYLRLAGNSRFLMANFSMCLIAAPILGYVGISSIIYMEHFHLSERAFALFFALVPLSSMAGAFLCTRLLARFSDRALIFSSLCGCLVASVVLALFGGGHLVAFVAGMSMFGFCTGVSRPLANHLILEQVDRDIGSASSLLIFTQFMAGALCMALTTAGWSRPVLVLALLTFLLPGVVLLAWPLLQRRLQFTPVEQAA